MKNLFLAVFVAAVSATSALGQYFDPETHKKKDEPMKRSALIIYPFANKAGFEFNFGKKHRLVAEYDLEFHYSRLSGSTLASNEIKLLYAFKNYAHSRVYAGLSTEAKSDYFSSEYWSADIYFSPMIGFQAFPSERVSSLGFIGQMVWWNLSDTRAYVGFCYRL